MKTPKSQESNRKRKAGNIVARGPFGLNISSAHYRNNELVTEATDHLQRFFNSLPFDHDNRSISRVDQNFTLFSSREDFDPYSDVDCEGDYSYTWVLD